MRVGWKVPCACVYVSMRAHVCTRASEGQRLTLDVFLDCASLLSGTGFHTGAHWFVKIN